MNMGITLLIGLLFVGIISLVVYLIFVAKRKIKERNFQIKNHINKKTATLILIIVAIIGLISVRVYIMGPNVSNITDNITKETQFQSIKGKFFIDSLFRKVSVYDNGFSVNGHFRYAGISITDKTTSYFHISKAEEDNHIDEMRLSAEINHGDLQKLLSHLEKAYGSPCEFTTDIKQKGSDLADALAGSADSEITRIYGLGAESIERNSELIDFFNKGDYVIIDAVEYSGGFSDTTKYKCEIFWCYTELSPALEWINRIWDESKNPNMQYLKSLYEKSTEQKSASASEAWKNKKIGVFDIKGEWKIVRYGDKKIDQKINAVFDEKYCNWRSDKNPYRLHKEGDRYTFECASYMGTEYYDVNVVDIDNIVLHLTKRVNNNKVEKPYDNDYELVRVK